jgi:hypothetical protein
VGVRPAFPPSLVVQVKALACELPHTLGLPLSRLSVEEIRQHVISQGLVAEISGATLWRWLSSDALRPWKHRSWIFPRDPNFAGKAGPILDLYQRVWEGALLGADDYVICADEKTSIQGRLLLLQARSEHEAALRQTPIEELQQAPAADQTKKELGRLRLAQTRWSSLSLAGEPFPALRLRCVDGAQVPKHPL